MEKILITPLGYAVDLSDISSRAALLEIAMWTATESLDCLGERGEIITVTREEAVERGRTLTRWVSSRSGEVLHLRQDGDFETENGGEVIARFPD